jgi:hypothetical protein
MSPTPVLSLSCRGAEKKGGHTHTDFGYYIKIRLYLCLIHSKNELELI